MQWSDIEFHPARRKLRQFAGICLVFFAALACWQGFVRGHPAWACGLAVAAIVLGVGGFLLPQALRLVYVGATVVSFPVGWAVSNLLLALVFYGIFTPVGLAFRILGRDALRRRRQPAHVSTYWQPKAAAPDAASYFRQF